MSNDVVILVMLGLFLGLSFLGTPVAFALIGAVLVGTALSGAGFDAVISQLFNGVNSVPLLALPFFLLVAELMHSTDVTTKIIRFVQSLVGHIRSSLAQVDSLFSIMFAGVSGSSTADVAANAKVLLPAMRKEGYDMASAAALIAASSTIANMIPPSILAVVYGAAGGVSIAGLFLGGAVPGLMIGAGLMLYAYFFVHAGEPRPRASFREIAGAAKGSALPMMIPLIIMGGILGGAFTPTEAGMIAAVFVIIVLIPLTARTHLPRLPRDFVNAAVLYALPLIAVAAASAFAWLFTYLGGAEAVSDVVLAIAGEESIGILLTVVVMLVVIGQFVDAIPAIIVLMPIIATLQEQGDVNPIHMGVVVIVTLALGLITPPYGLSLLLSTYFAKVSFYSGVRRSVPLYGIFFGVIALLVFFPEISLWLPRLLTPQAAGCFPAPGGDGFICP
jgi:C4-dicarboxylate transporter, DctM subunit